MHINLEQDCKVIVTTRSHMTEKVNVTLEALKEAGLCDRLLMVGGAGFKILQCLEGVAAYVYPSSGCKKWDTAATQAVLEAAGAVFLANITFNFSKMHFLFFSSSSSPIFGPIFGGHLTDVSGRQLYYGQDAQLINSGGILATAPWIDHGQFLDAIPSIVKDQLPEKIPINSSGY